jgi:hypothetical protein
MRTNSATARRLLVPAVALLGVAALAALAAAPRPERPATPRAPSAPLRRTKPPSPVGALALSVVDRPAPDRALLEARWRSADVAAPHDLELVLPESAFLVEGEAWLPLPAGAPEGTATWLVGLPTGDAGDAVVRLHAPSVPSTPDDPGTAAVEAVVRLAVPAEPR